MAGILDTNIVTQVGFIVRDIEVSKHIGAQRLC